MTNNDVGQRFTKRSRLPNAAAYSRVFDQAARSRDNFFTVLARGNGSRNARLGLAISKRHCRLAARRNRLKRVVRESFRQHQAALSGFDVVVLNKPGTHGASNQALFESLARHWRDIAAQAKRGRTKN